MTSPADSADSLGANSSKRGTYGCEFGTYVGEEPLKTCGAPAAEVEMPEGSVYVCDKHRSWLPAMGVVDA